MAGVVPPPPTLVDSQTLGQWHTVFKTDWKALVSIGYVDGATARMYTENVEGLENADGEVAFFGETYLEPEAQPVLKTSNVSFYGVSSSASDTGVMRVWMVDEDGDETIVDCTLTGTTPALLGSFVHCNMSMYLGGTAANVGDLTVSTKAIAGVPLVITDSVQTHVGIGRGHGNNPRQLCPNNQSFVFTSVDVSSDRSDGIHVHLHVGRNINGSGPHEMQAKQWFVYQSVLNETFDMPVALEAGEYMSMTLLRSASGTGAVNAGVNLDMYVLRSSSVTPTGGAGRLFV